MSHKPLIAKQKYRLNRRLIIFSLVFIFFTFITALLGHISMWNALPQYTPLPNWLFYPLIISFFIAFIDIILWFGILLSLETLGIGAVVYAFSLTGLYSFSWSIIGNNTFTDVLGLSLFIFDIIWYFDLFAPIHAVLTRTYWTSPQDRARKKYEKKFKFQNKEPESKSAKSEPKTSHTREELARLMNLWQQKYTQATTDEGRKEANEMILKYTTELEKLKAKSGTTPERAKDLDTGGDKE